MFVVYNVYISCAVSTCILHIFNLFLFHYFPSLSLRASPDPFPFLLYMISIYKVYLVFWSWYMYKICLNSLLNPLPLSSLSLSTSGCPFPLTNIHLLIYYYLSFILIIWVPHLRETMHSIRACVSALFLLTLLSQNYQFFCKWSKFGKGILCLNYKIV